MGLFNDDDEDNLFDKHFGDFFKSLREQAAMRMGAVIFGSAVAAYRKTLIENEVDEDTATALTVKTIEELVKGISNTLPGIIAALPPVIETLEKMRTPDSIEDEGPNFGRKEMPS